MIDPAVFIGKPLMFKNQIEIFPPTVGQVIALPQYVQFCKILTISQEDIIDDLAKRKIDIEAPTPFEFLLINCFHDETFKKIAEEAFRFFLHKPVFFLYEDKKIVVGDIDEIINTAKEVKEIAVIREEEYFAFQNFIRRAIGDKTLKPPEPTDPGEDPRIARIKAKARERDRIKARQGSKNGISLSTSLIAICCMGIGITPLNIGEMSYAAIGPIMTMMQDKEKYDVDIRSLLAGADSKKIKPKYWIRNSDKE